MAKDNCVADFSKAVKEIKDVGLQAIKDAINKLKEKKREVWRISNCMGKIRGRKVEEKK